MTTEANRPRSDHKQFCRSIAPEGWAYTGFDSGFYMFQTGNYRDGFREMLALDEDLDAENLAFMAGLNMTRVAT